MQWPPAECIKSQYNLLNTERLLISINEDDPLSDITDTVTKYLIVRCCGHLEIVTYECMTGLLTRNSNACIERYLRGSIKTYRSPKPEMLQESLKKINPSLSESFKTDFLNKQCDYQIATVVSFAQVLCQGSLEGVPEIDPVNLYLDTNRISMTNSQLLKQLVNERGAIAHGKSIVSTASGAIDYARFSTRLGIWFMDFCKPGGEAERIMSATI